MVATVVVYQAYGGTDGAPLENYIDGTAGHERCRLQTKDQFVPTDTTYPVPIPTSGLNYSYWVHVYLKITGGTFTKINNVRFYSDGAIGWTYGTNGKLRRGHRDTGDQGAPMDTEYDVATGTEGTTGDGMENTTSGHGYYLGQVPVVSDVASDTSGSPATVDSTDHTGTGKCKAVVMQVAVDTDATQGDQADETLTFKYDEI